MSRAYSTAILVLIAFWPVWSWYVQRTFDRSDEPLGLLALVSLIGLVWFRSSTKIPLPESTAVPSAISNVESKSTTSIKSIVGMGILLLIYMLSFGFVPKVISAAIAVITTAFVATTVLRLCKLLPGDWLLALLSLPLVASLNFFFGFPLRVFVTIVACFLLRISGFAVDANGTELIFAGQTIEVDAPCSGVKMLWFSFYLGAAFASYYLMPWRSTLLILPVALGSALLGNIIRVTSLFYIETGIISVASIGTDPHFVHEATGVAAFLFQGILIFLFAQFLSAKEPHADSIALLDNVPAVSENAPVDERGRISELGALSPNSIGRTVPGSHAVPGKGLLAWSTLSLLCIIAAGLPFLQSTVDGASSSAVASTKFPGWPKTVFGLDLRALPDSPQDQVFLQGFPGKAARFQSGGAQVVMRWVNQESRQVHPSSDCYRGMGYEVSWLPILIDGKGHRWRHFTASKGNEELEIKELIYDEQSRSWSDVSSWYWDAATKKTQAPWWVLTVIEPRAPQKTKT